MALTKFTALSSSSILALALIWTYFPSSCEGCLTVDQVPKQSSDTREMFPWVAAIFKRDPVNGKWVYHCGATITVATYTVITAASCVTKLGTDLQGYKPFHLKYTDLKIVAGLSSSDYYTGRDEHTQESDVGMIREFQAPKSSVDGYQQTYLRSSNLAGIRLKTEFNQTKFVAPVCLVETPNSIAELLTLAPGEHGLVAGFDQAPTAASTLESTAEVLKVFEFQITDPITCVKSYSSSTTYFNVACGKFLPTVANESASTATASFPCHMDGAGLIVSTDEVKTGVGKLYMIAIYTGNTITVAPGDQFYPYPVPQTNRTCHSTDTGSTNVNLAYFTKHGEHYRWALSHVFCSSDLLQCQSDSCRPLEELCDGKIQCNDGTDETDTICTNQFECSAGQFRCNYGVCIDELKVCDGNSDCADNSDEADEELCREADKKRNVTCPLIPEQIGVESRCFLPSYLGGSQVSCHESQENPIVLPVGTKLEQSCKKYYKLESDYGNNVVTSNCNRNGTWSTTNEEERIRCKPACGISETNKIAYVIGGETVNSYGEWPWHVAIYRDFNNVPALICGGTLISPRVVLTAAHCLVQTNGGVTLPTKIHRVLFGNLVSNYSQAKQEILTQEIEIMEFIIHEYYDAKSYEADIALIILKSPGVQITSAVRPVCLTMDEEFTAIQLNNANPINGSSHLAVTVGFGVDETKQPSATLKQVKLPIIPKTDCEKSLTAQLHESIRFTWLCAGYVNGTTVCNGDSGGGLVIPFDFYGVGRKYYVQGLVSHGVKSHTNDGSCDKHTYKIFTQISRFITWIQPIVDNYI